MKGVAMPPKARITKEMILNTVLEITQKSGFETANARNIANKLQCSTRPIFTCYENMEELKKHSRNSLCIEKDILTLTLVDTGSHSDLFNM